MVSASQIVPPLVLTLDIGTSAVRALLFDGQARQVAGVAAREPAPLTSGADGASELDPAELLARVVGCVDAALAGAGPLAAQIAAVAVDTLATTTLALDGAGRPLTPIFTYADTRATADAEALRRRFDERAIHQRTGCLLRASYWPARLAWLRRTRPDVFARAAGWATLGDYLELELLGRRRVSTSAASWTGLLGREALAWDGALADELGVALEQLAPLADAAAPRVGLLPEYAARWPALRDVPWFPAMGDGAAANVGSGCDGPDAAALTLGTTGAVRVAMPQVAQVPPGLWCYRVDQGRALLGGATSEGGNVFAWMRGALQLPADPAALECELAGMAPDAHGLTLLPFWAGERSPGWAGDVRATIHGLTLGTTPVEILRAAMEAVALRFALIVAQIEEAGAVPGRIVAGGGALLASPTWMQIVADALGRPLLASAEPEATARGAALLALAGIGAVAPDARPPAALGATYTPDPGAHAAYRAALERQRRLYAALV